MTAVASPRRKVELVCPAGALPALKAALVASISALLEHTSFCIIAYAGEARPVTGVQWVKAGDAEKGSMDTATTAATRVRVSRCELRLADRVEASPVNTAPSR